MSCYQNTARNDEVLAKSQMIFLACLPVAVLAALVAKRIKNRKGRYVLWSDSSSQALTPQVLAREVWGAGERSVRCRRERCEVLAGDVWGAGERSVGKCKAHSMCWRDKCWENTFEMMILHCCHIKTLSAFVAFTEFLHSFPPAPVQGKGNAQKYPVHVLESLQYCRDRILILCCQHTSSTNDPLAIQW